MLILWITLLASLGYNPFSSDAEQFRVYQPIDSGLNWQLYHIKRMETDTLFEENLYYMYRTRTRLSCSYSCSINRIYCFAGIFFKQNKTCCMFLQLPEDTTLQDIEPHLRIFSDAKKNITDRERTKANKGGEDNDNSDTNNDFTDVKSTMEFSTTEVTSEVELSTTKEITMEFSITESTCTTELNVSSSIIPLIADVTDVANILTAAPVSTLILYASG